MAKIERTINIAAPVEKVCAYLTEPANWPEFWPSMVECQGTERAADTLLANLKGRLEGQ